jgi:hypothetical protein
MIHKILNYITLITLVLCSYCHAQQSDFIVTNSLDTIYVEKISTTDDKVKTVLNGKKNKYNMDEIISYYISTDNKHYERVKNPLADKLKAKQIDRYDYRALETAHIDEYEKRIEYKYFHRLTEGKVKLFKKVVTFPASGDAYHGNFQSSYDDVTYYISIYDSKLELINPNQGLELTEEFYELLKIYLHGIDEIQNKLEKLFLSKPKANKKQIIDLINEYNSWVETKKQ